MNNLSEKEWWNTISRGLGVKQENVSYGFLEEAAPQAIKCMICGTEGGSPGGTCNGCGGGLPGTDANSVKGQLASHLDSMLANNKLQPSGRKLLGALIVALKAHLDKIQVKETSKCECGFINPIESLECAACGKKSRRYNNLSPVPSGDNMGDVGHLIAKNPPMG